MGTHLDARVEAPEIFLHIGFESHLLFATRSQWPDPYHAEFRPMLTVLKNDLTAYFERAAHRAESHSGRADIEGVHQVRIGTAVVVAGNTYRQDGLRPVQTAFIVHSFHVLSVC